MRPCICICAIYARFRGTIAQNAEKAQGLAEMLLFLGNVTPKLFPIKPTIGRKLPCRHLCRKWHCEAPAASLGEAKDVGYEGLVRAA